jgi:hypothetical protein
VTQAGTVSVLARASRWATAVAILTILAVPLKAQWKTPNKPGTPLTHIDLNAPAPRSTDGKPDFSGLWGLGPVPGTMMPAGERLPVESLPPDVSRASSNQLALGVPTTDEAKAIVQARAARLFRDNPRSQCRPMGIMQLHTMGTPVKVIQLPAEMVLLYESNFERRQIFTDGRRPPEDPQPFWNGYSVGRWEGDTLVVETTGFRDDGWLDMTGTPLSDAARITERFTRPSLARMYIDVTIEDRKTFLRPFTVRVSLALRPDDELIETVCLENQKFGPEPGTDRSIPGPLIHGTSAR